MFSKSDARSVWTYLGAGAVLALWFALVRTPGGFTALGGLAYDSQFLADVCGGAFACGALALLLCIKDSYRPLPLRKRSAVLFFSLVALSSFSMILGIALLAANVMLGLGSAPIRIGSARALGFGIALASFLWFDSLIHVSVRTLARHAFGILVVFACLRVPSAFFHGEWLLGYATVLIATATLGLILSPAEVQEKIYKEPADTYTAISEKLSTWVRSSWRTVVVVLIALFLLGSNWNPLWTEVIEIDVIIITIEQAIGALLTVIVCAFIPRAESDADALAIFQNVVIFAVVATFVVVPYFPMDNFISYFYEIVGLIRESSFLIFATGLFLILAATSRTANVSSFASVGLATIACNIALLGGALVVQTFGSEANAAAGILFVIYLVAATITSFFANSVEGLRIRTIQRDVFENYLTQRCEKISEQFGLSPRESEILIHLGRGHGYVYISELAFIAESTVRTHAKSIFKKCGVSSREGLIDLIDGKITSE